MPETRPEQTLELLRVADGSVETITPLFGEHFLDEFAAATANVTAAELGDTAIEDVTLAIWQTLACGLHARAWSPNGRYLAFAAALDGGSADLYVYDTQTGAITRESAGPEQIVDISWSPEGRWMLYASTTVRAYASLDHIHAVAVDGHARLSNVDAGLLSRVVWAGPDIFLNFSAGDTDSGYNLRAVDLTDGTQRSLCAGGFYSFAVDREMGLVAANCQIGLSSTDLSGLYLFDLKTSRQTKVSDDVGLVEAWGLGNGRFRVRGLEGGDEILAAAGSRTPWPWGEGAAVPAPGGSYFVVITQQAMQVYDAAGEWVRTIELLGGNGQDAVRWRPDDLGLFYQRGPQLYAVDTLTGEPRLVDSLPEGAEAYGMQWVAR